MIAIHRPTPARALLWLLVLSGAAVAAVRFIWGLGAVTNLSDHFPWGVWIGFDVMVGVALAAGAFTLNATVHLFHLDRYRALLRPAVLTGFLGYLMVIIALLVDLGRPWNIWHPLVMWNPHSVMFEVAWCVMLYTATLALEFSQPVFERLRLWRMLHIARTSITPLVVAAVILSTLHQSSLGSLFLIAPGKLHPLWYTALLPLLFFISAVAVGLAMATVEAVAAARIFKHPLDLPMFVGLSRAMLVTLSVYLGMKVLDIAVRGAWTTLFVPGIERLMFGAELGVGVVLPLLLLSVNHYSRSPAGLTLTSVLVVLGVVLNRLNVAVTGMLSGSGALYVPAWTEILITAAIVAAGILTYLWVMEHLPIITPHAPAAVVRSE
jgi:Ni/Fe-hydrogenase subunit HybB-like protein